MSSKHSKSPGRWSHASRSLQVITATKTSSTRSTRVLLLFAAHGCSAGLWPGTLITYTVSVVDAVSTICTHSSCQCRALSICIIVSYSYRLYMGACCVAEIRILLTAPARWLSPSSITVRSIYLDLLLRPCEYCNEYIRTLKSNARPTNINEPGLAIT